MRVIEGITCRCRRGGQGEGRRRASSRRPCGGSCRAGPSTAQASPSAGTVTARTPPPSISPAAFPFFFDRTETTIFGSLSVCELLGQNGVVPEEIIS